MKVTQNIEIEDARLIFKNFSGLQTGFNPAGNRNFCVLLNEGVARELKDYGWNVKYLRPRDPEDNEQPYLQVAVRFDNFPPAIWIGPENTNKKTKLDESNVNILDHAEIVKVDLSIKPYNWENNGKSGVKAYLKSMYVTVAEDKFASKYELEE